MTSIVRRKLKVGDRFASQQHYHVALSHYRSAYEDILSNPGDGVKLPAMDLESVQKVLESGKCKSTAIAESQFFADFRDAQARAHGVGLDEFPRMFTYHTTSTNQWIVAYNQVETPAYGDLQITIPEGTTQAFVVTIGKDGVKSVALPPNKTRLLGYAMAHFAWALAQSTIAIYMNKDVLSDTSWPTILNNLEYFDCSLHLVPDNAWTWAHYADIYRTMGNAWLARMPNFQNRSASVAGLQPPTLRIEQYTRALIYFFQAVKLNPNESWALAHLGATLVNARGYAGATDDAPMLFAAIRALLAPDLVSDEQLEMRWLRLAFTSLDKAQEIADYYYPWAQLYQADSILLLSLFDGKEPSQLSHDALVEALLQTNFAYILQPKLAEGVFDPGQIYHNPLLQCALMELWRCHQRPDRLAFAWTCAKKGMARLFGNAFVPGVAAVTGYQLLANISSQRIALGSSENKGASAATFESPNAPVPIGPTPIDNCEDLCDFIDNVFELVCKPTAEPFLSPDIAVNTTIKMSLVQVYLVLLNLRDLLLATKITQASVVADKIGAYSMGLREKLGVTMDQATQFVHQDHLNNMLAMLGSGGPSYKMAKLLNPTN